MFIATLFSISLIMAEDDFGYNNLDVPQLQPPTNFSALNSSTAEYLWTTEGLIDNIDDILHSDLSNLLWSNAGHTMDATLDMNGNNIFDAGDLNVTGTGTFGDNLTISKNADGSDVNLILRNTAGGVSLDETVSLKGQTTSSNYDMGKIVFGRMNNYGPSDERDSFMDFYTTLNDVDTLALRIDENQDFNFTGSLINPKVDNKLMIGLGAVDTASISTVFGDDLIFTDETGSANVQWNAFGEMHFGGASLSNVGNIDTTIIDATEIYNSVANFDIMPDAQYNVDVFADGDPHYLISNSADGKAFKVHRNAVSETDSAVQLYNDRYSRPAIYGYGGDFVFWIPDDDILIYSSDGDIDLQGGSSGDVTIFEFAGSGENPSVRQGGYITNGANEVEVSWTVKDTDDYFWLERESSNINGLKVDMPIYMPNDNHKFCFGAGDDACIYFDATNLVINPANLGAGGTAIGVEASPNAFLEATGNGALAGGYAVRSISGSGTIKASGFGSVALGSVQGVFNDPYLQATNQGSIAMGYANQNNITSSGTGSFAVGYAGAGNIVASNSGAVAIGEDVEATALNSMVLGNGVDNNITNSLMIGFNDEDLRVQDDNVTIFGDITATGDLDIDGSTLLDATRIDGQLDVNGNLNMNSNSYDIILKDNDADAIEIGVNAETQHMTFDTTNTAEKTIFGYDVDLLANDLTTTGNIQGSNVSIIQADNPTLKLQNTAIDNGDNITISAFGDSGTYGLGEIVFRSYGSFSGSPDNFDGGIDINVRDGTFGILTNAIRIDHNGRVGILMGENNIPTYPLTVNDTHPGQVSIWAVANVSATGYITRTTLFNKSQGSALDLIKDADDLKTDGKIDHSKFYGYSPVTVFNENIGKNVTEEGVSLNMEVDVLRQAVYELKTELCLHKAYNWC
jgi:hypothetical protein